MNQPPLNPDALGRMFATAMMEVLDAEKLQPGDRLVHVNDLQEVLNRLEKNILAAALPEVTSVEEIEALPEGSVFIDGDGEVCQIEIDGESHFNGDPYRRFSVVGDYKDHELDEAIFPARVLYRPEVKP